jgi:hypothetical protein
MGEIIMKKLLKLFTAALLSLGIFTGVALPQDIVPAAPQNVAYAKSVKVNVVSFTSYRTKGQWATIKVKGKARSYATIAVYYNSGASRSKYLNPQNTNSKGYASWRWKVGTRTAPGSYRVVITVGGKTITTYLKVG